MNKPTLLITAAVAGSATLMAATPIVSASAPPDSELAFLQTEMIDETVAAAENSSANCAALESIGGLLLVIGMSSMGSDETETGELGSNPTELLLALYAPYLAPLLERTTPPSDPSWATAIDVIGGELRATIDELRQLGLTDEDILLLQSDPMGEPTESTASGSEPSGSDGAFPPQYQVLLDHDFESLTFLDPDGALGGSPPSDLENLWGDECPETVALFSFDMEPVDVEMDFSVTVGGSEPVAEMNVTVNGSEVPISTSGG